MEGEEEGWWEGGREEVMVVYTCRWNEGKGYNILGYKS